MQRQRNFGGRPRRKPKAGERVHLGFRVTPQTKKLLEETAARTGRSISQEAEMRIEQSLSHAQAFGGQELQRMAFLMVAAFERAGSKRSAKSDAKDWINDSEAYRAAMFGVINALLIGLPDATDEDIAREIESLKGKLVTRVIQKKKQGKSA